MFDLALGLLALSVLVAQLVLTALVLRELRRREKPVRGRGIDALLPSPREHATGGGGGGVRIDSSFREQR